MCRHLTTISIIDVLIMIISHQTRQPNVIKIRFFCKYLKSFVHQLSEITDVKSTSLFSFSKLTTVTISLNKNIKINEKGQNKGEI